MPETAETRFQLTPTQRGLYEALIDKGGHYGKWYRTAIGVLNDPRLPDRLALAAHGLREVMEKLPGDGVSVDRAAALPDKVRRLGLSWERANESNQHGGGAWTGEISDELREFLADVQHFFAGQEQLIARRKDHARQFLNELDVAPAGLPEDLQVSNARQWMVFHSYFAAVAHHRPVDEAEFRGQVSAFESFLSARLNPRPTEDFAAIDAFLSGE